MHISNKNVLFHEKSHFFPKYICYIQWILVFISIRVLYSSVGNYVVSGKAYTDQILRIIPYRSYMKELKFDASLDLMTKSKWTRWAYQIYGTLLYIGWRKSIHVKRSY